MVTPEQFRQHAAAEENFNRVPVVREVLSDLDTPLSVYLKLADAPHTYLLESVEGGERFGRYSIIGLPAARTVAFRGHSMEVREHGQVIEQREVADPFAEVEALRTSYSVPKLEGLPGFTGGPVGWFGFECIGYIEPRLTGGDKPDELGTPDIYLMLSEELAVFDNLKGRLYLVVHADPREPGSWDAAQARLDALVDKLRAPGSYPLPLSRDVLDESHFVSGFTREGFIEAVEKSKEYIRAGDVFQVVLSQRMSVPFNARPVDVYRALRALNPSPYMYFLDTGEVQVVGSSPEILVRQQGDEVTVRPIAGTRPRGATPAEDLALEQDLLADPKERAEHLMLIDLGRNDVGRVAEAGSVEVGERFVIERYSHVMHIVSEVTGKLLRPELRRRAARDLPGRHGQRRAEDPRAGSDPRTRAGQAQCLRRQHRLHRLARRRRYRDRDPHRGDQGWPPARAGRCRHRLRLRPAGGMGRDHEQGPRAVPRGGAGGEGVVMAAGTSFRNDYSEGAHPRLLQALVAASAEQNAGYGLDRHSLRAAALIRARLGGIDADVHFISGGTQANLLAIASFLRPHQAAVSVQGGHIATHETGAIEATGHKVLTVPAGIDGKLTAALVAQVLGEHTDEHMVQPKLVYVSNSSEVGTVYSRAELQSLSAFCRERGLLLFLDGARLGSALAAECNDLALADIAALCDAFYIGGTKNGALAGEALVVCNDALKPDLRYLGQAARRDAGQGHVPRRAVRGPVRGRPVPRAGPPRQRDGVTPARGAVGTGCRLPRRFADQPAVPGPAGAGGRSAGATLRIPSMADHGRRPHRHPPRHLVGDEAGSGGGFHCRCARGPEPVDACAGGELTCC